MLEKLKKPLDRGRTLASRLYAWARRALNGRLGFYAALALLLTLLGLASHAYRERSAERARADAVDAPKPVAAMRQSESASEPEADAPKWVWPLEGEIIGAYSPGEPVWSDTLGQWQNHPALDIAGTPGEAVFACADGTVSDAWSDRLWGNVIVIAHEDGYASTYAGVNTLKLVSPGDAVAAGDVISAVGAGAESEADLPAHLHFELKRDGESVDIRDLIGKPAP